MNDLDAIMGIRSKPGKSAGRRPIPLPGDMRLARTPRRRLFHNAMKAKNCRQALQALPGPDESLHIIATGMYDLFDIVPTMLELAGGAAIQELRLCSLGFNFVGTRRLCDLLEAGQVRRCCMMLSHYFASDKAEADTIATLSRELPRHGGWICFTRSHAKIIGIHFADGRHFVVESSANLRSCRAVEQLCITHSEELYNFHAAWQDALYEHEHHRNHVA